MDLDSLVLRDLKGNYVLTRDRGEHKNYISRLNLSRTLWQNTKLNGRRELVSTKETISYRGAKSFVSTFLGESLSPTFIIIPYFPFVSVILVFNRLLYFAKCFAKYSSLTGDDDDDDDKLFLRNGWPTKGV